MRVTRVDDSTFVLFDVAVLGDSLIGFTGADLLGRLAIPVVEVKKLEKQELSRPARYVRIYYILVLTVGSIVLAGLALAMM